jgi:glutamate dehydrogenase
MWPCALRYFPPSLSGAFPDLVRRHPLFRQLLASELANEVIERMGAIWAHELAAEAGHQLWEVAAAYWAAREILDVADFCDLVDGLAWDPLVDAEVSLREALSGAIDRLACWYITRPGSFQPGDAIALDRGLARQLRTGVKGSGPLATALQSLGVEPETAHEAGRITVLSAIGELAEIARSTGRGLEDVVKAHHAVELDLGVPSLSEALQGRPYPDRWERWQSHLLADDLARVRTEATRKALVSHPGADGGDAARMWLADSSEELARPGTLVEQFKRTAAPSLSLRTLVVRSLADAVAAVTTPSKSG